MSVAGQIILFDKLVEIIRTLHIERKIKLVSAHEADLGSWQPLDNWKKGTGGATYIFRESEYWFDGAVTGAASVRQKPCTIFVDVRDHVVPGRIIDGCQHIVDAWANFFQTATMIPEGKENGISPLMMRLPNQPV